MFGNDKQRRGRLWVISAPSGAGKTSLVRELCARRPQLVKSVSYTTRKKRRREREGFDYHFVDEQKFQEMVAAGAFLEHAQVFDNYYATGRAEVEKTLAGGRNVILEIDWQGAGQTKATMPGAGTIFILPPSYEELERRLRGRGSDSEEVVQRRLSQAMGDMTHWSEFDYVIVNENFGAAAASLEEILDGQGARFRSETPGVRRKVAGVLDEPAFLID